jgi:ribosome maturation factor RimP
MKTPADIRQKLLEIAEPVCADNGYELVDIEYTTAPSGWVVRVYIDRLADSPLAIHEGGISFDDCERLSRQLGAVLDVEDPVPHKYSLEVSSPGLDRPLRTAEHFQRYLGETAKVALGEPQGGRRNFKGVLRTLEPSPGPDAQVLVIEVDGVAFRLPLAGIASARLVPDWDSLMKGGSQGRGRSESSAKKNQSADPDAREDGNR